VSGAWLPYGRQLIEEDDIEAVVAALRSSHLTTGPQVEAFEAELADACGAAHAIVVANGTAALHCAYVAAGIESPAEVITTPLTFSATSNAVLALGGTPVFADIEESTLCLDPKDVERRITPRTRAIAPVDFAGNPSVTDSLMSLARARGLLVVEDASHSIGGKVSGKPIGSIADLATFSFHPVKTITTGEGGAVLTNDAQLAQRARDFRNHGLVRDASRFSYPEGAGGWYYEIQSLGLNYRLTDIQCALGRSQLKKLTRFVERRRQIVRQYRDAFAQLAGITLQKETPDCAAAWHLFPIRVDGGAQARHRLFNLLQARRIGVQVHYVAVNEMPLYRRLGYRPEDTPIARRASQSIISLPLFPAMTDSDVQTVIDAVKASITEL
jgi:UDP-4-amino-4,6-dideoxy-N-acetyl-beta-L-altrosamine transaminase